MTTRVSAYESLRERAAERIEDRKLDAEAHPEQVRATITEVVGEYQATSHRGINEPLRDPDDMEQRIWQAVAGFGPLTELLAAPHVEEIFIEGPRISYIDDSGRLRAHVVSTTEAELRHVIDRLLAGTNRRLDRGNAIEQAHVLNGTARLTAVVPPVSSRLSATLRKYTVAEETLGSMVALDSLSPAAAAFLWATAQANTSILYSGATGAGKTTLMSAWLRAVPSDQCIRIVEEVRELHIPLPPHSSYYEASPVSLQGERRFTLRDLVKVSLAQRVDLLCVGEVRGAEAFELTRAVNAGCGFACTVHANSARDALAAIVNAAIMAGENVTEQVVRRVFANSIDFVVHLDRDMRRQEDSDHGIRRQVCEILAVTPSLTSGDFTTEPIFVRSNLGEPIRWTGAYPQPDISDRIDRALPSRASLHGILNGAWSPEL
ncbi:MAG: ATPase, T2SS/T4P/T4SS family [Acidimicrobiia bacterium]|nr:ATPase, T2SS/T4P/T4SS family [Acidimicrobiia bacterium]